MKILITGAAGFIGFFTSKRLLEEGHTVIGLDNINAYYSTDLKYARLKELGINPLEAERFSAYTQSDTYPLFHFIRLDLGDKSGVNALFAAHNPDIVINLAAQAGVRYSLEHPDAYVSSNVTGFLNLLESCRAYGIEHFIYASSSSVYGVNKKVPFSTTDTTDQPVSLYAATKKSNELMAHTYSHLFGFPSTGLRFFTVYGPWGRPDMAYFSFTKAILEHTAIPVFNEGKLSRDFTYIDDIVDGIARIVALGFKPSMPNMPNTSIYNIGRGAPVELMDFIATIGKALGEKPILEMLPMQEGDVYTTWADTQGLQQQYAYLPKTPLDMGLKTFTDWYRSYHKIN